MDGNVLLIYPRRVTGWQVHPRMAIPWEFLHIASRLRTAGYRVKIIDQRIERDWHSVLKDEVEQGPVCIGITSRTGPQLHNALIASRVARKYGNAPIVWMGVHASLVPEQTLDSGDIDIIVHGEEPETFSELVAALAGKGDLNKVRGIWYKENGRIRQTGVRPFIDLNRQPPPAFDLIDRKMYARSMFGVDNLNFFTSRGCPHRCTYCFENIFSRFEWRSMDPDIAIQQIGDFVKSFNLRGMTFGDLNFFHDMDRGRKILEGIIREGLNIIISKINVRADSLSRMSQEDFSLLEKAGCRRITIGVESGSERIQSLLKKPIDVPGLRKTNRGLKGSPIVPVYFFMMGFPSETKKDLEESVSLSLSLQKENPNAVTGFNIFTPFPGTELFDMAVKHGLRIPQRTEEWISFNYRNNVKNAPWLSEDLMNKIEMIDFCSNFVGRKHLLDPYEKTAPFVSLVSRFYSPIAKMRIRHFWDRFPAEVKLAKLLGLYARQK
jgi:anaerobic magnesium-protoporphyrin IX monomethyl ester cyclase